MMQQKWTSRTFHFDFTTAMFPVFIARLRGAYPQIKYAIEDLPEQKLVICPHGKWSIKQHIGHLTDLEELHMLRIKDYRLKKPLLQAWDGVNEKTEKASHNTKHISSILSDFKESRNVFIQALLSFTDAELEQSALHPRLQKNMRIADLAYFVAEHDDHHIAAMYAIKEELI